MSRKSNRRYVRAQRGVDAESDRFYGLARLDPLVHPARPNFDDLDVDQYGYLISTGPVASRPTAVRGRSPQLAVRATGRSRSVGSLIQDVIHPPRLLARAIVCAKRSIRREVLFAFGVRSKGSGSGNRRRSSSSKFRC